jgi:hypothetical protein
MAFKGLWVLAAGYALLAAGCGEDAARGPASESSTVAGTEPKSDANPNAEVDAEINKDPFLRAYLQAVVPCDEAHQRYADLIETGGLPAAAAAKNGIEACDRAARLIADLPAPKGRETAPQVCAGSPRVKADMIRLISGEGDASAKSDRVIAMVADSDSKVDACVATAVPK